MTTYRMAHFEIVAPKVRNDGTPSGYPAALAALLDRNGFGYTAVDSIGGWHGKREAGVTFTIFGDPRAPILSKLAQMARASMPDQEAIQVVEYAPVNLTEA